MKFDDIFWKYLGHVLNKVLVLIFTWVSFIEADRLLVFKYIEPPFFDAEES